MDRSQADLLMPGAYLVNRGHVEGPPWFSVTCSVFQRFVLTGKSKQCVAVKIWLLTSFELQRIAWEQSVNKKFEGTLVIHRFPLIWEN